MLIFNSYDPDQAVSLYPTDGTTEDFAYGELGLAAYTFELGTAFFQSCETFENTILPDNIPGLIYAAKTARTPYQTPSGPDVLEITTTPIFASPGDEIILNATINDTRFNNVNGTELSQTISAAEYHIDSLPWESGSASHQLTAADGNFNSAIEEVIAIIDTTDLSVGQHTIYLRGQDADGNWGATSAIFITLQNFQYLPFILR